MVFRRAVVTPKLPVPKSYLPLPRAGRIVSKEASWRCSLHAEHLGHGVGEVDVLAGRRLVRPVGVVGAGRRPDGAADLERARLPYGGGEKGGDGVHLAHGGDRVVGRGGGGARADGGRADGVTGTAGGQGKERQRGQDREGAHAGAGRVHPPTAARLWVPRGARAASRLATSSRTIGITCRPNSIGVVQQVVAARRQDVDAEVVVVEQGGGHGLRGADQGVGVARAAGGGGGRRSTARGRSARPRSAMASSRCEPVFSGLGRVPAAPSGLARRRCAPVIASTMRWAFSHACSSVGAEDRPEGHLDARRRRSGPPPRAAAFTAPICSAVSASGSPHRQ